ncbi:MAG TPA: HAD family acid phosphatase [Sphingomonas sp.]|nr:HAD family acid phosphatase [Sphingomonas sp.]
MTRAAPLIALLAGAALLQGCVVAAVPVAAGAAIARERFMGGDHDSDKPLPKPPAGKFTYLGPVDNAAIGMATVPPAMQYLYGSGEAAAASLQTYRALDTYMMARSSDRAIGHEVKSVVLAPGATFDAPKFTDCGEKPLAVVFDVDETAVLNLGFEADQAKRGGAYDQQRWLRWEKTGADDVVPVPGVLDAIEIARQANVKVIFNSNRAAENAEATAAMLKQAGFGDVVVGDSLWLANAGEQGKDRRRWAIAQQYCVIAQVGDQLGDFTDLFNSTTPGVAERRALASAKNVEWLWGLGWFLLPNPVYGSALKGSFNEVFPNDKQWTDPADKAPAAPAPAAVPPITNGSEN